ncbi:MAG: NADH-ubiquinone oxidoreductase subunit NDUFA12 family protein, partial [Sphingopyxis sp.]
MAILGKIFTWWDGATIGTLLFSARNGVNVGEDSLGNRYFQSRNGDRRWVIYNGSNDASRVPPEWHGW